MKIVSLRKISVILGLMLFSTVITLGLINHNPTYAKGDSMSDFSAKKMQVLDQIKAKTIERGKEYSKTHPIISQKLPVPPDPKLEPKRIPPDEGWQIEWLYNGPYRVSELWLVGDKLNCENNDWNNAFAYSGSLNANLQQGFIGTFVRGGTSDQSWTGTWNTPQLWGSVKITNVTGNIVSFVTDSGVKGTFNLDTHKWKTN